MGVKADGAICIYMIVVQRSMYLPALRLLLRCEWIPRAELDTIEHSFIVCFMSMRWPNMGVRQEPGGNFQDFSYRGLAISDKAHIDMFLTSKMIDSIDGHQCLSIA